MGNVNSSAQLDGEVATGVSRHQPLEMSIQGSTKSWATMDHTLTGPWSFLVKEEVQCLCEGGRSCSHENPARQQGPNAIPGLHSSWVGGQVLAMARPWQENVAKHDVVARFKEHNISMIINLQEVGEHESCGPGNLSASGFTYNPETFMAAKIGVYNISWRDMGVPTLDKLMDIVQIMQYTTMVECRKVAVHCHAGLGRTGLSIACFLLASGQAGTAAAAVEMVRAARPGSLQTQAQVVFVSIFEQYLQHLRCLFKVADLKHISLGNTNYIVTKVCRRISRSLSGAHQLSATGTPDALATAAAAALSPLTITTCGSGGSSVSGSAPTSATAAAAAAQAQPDWASATYELMSPTEALQLAGVGSAVGNAAVPANAALNLGAAAGAPGSGQEGLVMHVRRLSGGGNLKVVSNLKAIEEEGDKPVHVIQTDNAVTEVYGHGLTIIRATDSVKKMRAAPAAGSIPTQRPAEQQLLTPHELGLDKQLPWNDRFAIRPEAFKAEGWLPEPPNSYLEALRRQQRLLHGNERRRCLHQHKLLRAAAKALAAAAQAYKAVPAHTDASQITPSTSGAASPTPTFKRMHSRSRSNASAIDLLAVAGGLSPCGSGIPLQDVTRSHSTGSGNPQQPIAGITAAAAGAGSTGASPKGNMLSKQQQQQLLLAGLVPSAAGRASVTAAAVAAPDSAAALLPGLHLGPPGTVSMGMSTDGAAGAVSGGAARKLSRQGSSAKKGGVQASAAGFFLTTSHSEGSTAPAAVPGPGSPAGAGAGAACCTPCLAGCCAPSFAVGLLIALLYKGRFPEEYEAQWSGCPRLKALGLDEGHAVCQALQDVKLAVNAGAYGPLEAASGAVAVCVLADWFEGFSQEAFSEATLELLVDEAEALLAEALAAAAAARAQEAQAQQQQQQGQDRSSMGGTAVQQPQPQPVGDDPAVLARRAAARAICSSLAPYEQDLCLLLAAVLRHIRTASLEDPRLQEYGFSSSSWSGGRVSAAGGYLSSSGSSSSSKWTAVEAQVDAAMAVLYRLVAGWLLGPLALACVPALEAVAAFLHYLTMDDTAYRCLLQAIQQGVRRARSAPAAGKGGLWDSIDSTGNGSNAPNSPRAQQQQNLDRLEKLKARLLGAGSTFKLQPLHLHTHKSAGKQGSNSSVSADGQQGSATGTGAGESTGVLAGQPPAAGAAAAHSIGKSKLRHVSSSPDLSQLQQQQQAAAQAPGSPTRHGKSKLGAVPPGALAAVNTSKACSCGGHVGVGQAAGGQRGQVLQAEPESKGCADALTLLLSHKLHSLSSRKHPPPPLPQQQQQQQQDEVEAACGMTKATAGLQLKQAPQQQPVMAAAGAAAGPSPRASVSSSCGGDSISELIHAGNCHELCVGRQAEGSGCRGTTEAPLQDELAVLPGQQQQQQQLSNPVEAVMDSPGVLDSPPRSVSPEAFSTRTSAGGRHPGRTSGSSNSGSRQHTVNVHMRLPPMQRNSFDALSDCASSFTGSPCSSLGSISGLLLAAQAQQLQPGQLTVGIGSTSSMGTGEAPPAASSGGAGGAVAGCAAANSTDLSGHQAVSLSALSDLQLQGSSPRVGVSGQAARLASQ